MSYLPSFSSNATILYQNESIAGKDVHISRAKNSGIIPLLLFLFWISIFQFNIYVYFDQLRKLTRI